MVRPSGLKATLFTGPQCPVMVRTGVPSAAFQIRIVLS